MSTESQKAKGNILLFYAYDVGDYIDIEKIINKNILNAKIAEPFPHFKNYHIPLSVNPAGIEQEENLELLSAKVHNFGVLSFSYKVPFTETFDNLKVRMIEEEKRCSKIAEQQIKGTFDAIKKYIHDPIFHNMQSTYFAVHVDNKNFNLSGEDLVAKHGSTITSLLRSETKKMSGFQKEEILSSATGYYGSDLIIIDGQGAFIYDYEYIETVDFLELANIQKVELQSFDKLLDSQLNKFYNSSSTLKPSLKSYIPLIGTTWDKLSVDLARLRVDISVIAERLNNNVNLTGDVYFENLYNTLVEKLKIKDWKSSIEEKMSIISEMYSVRRGRLATIREELLMVVIIILIAFEAAMAFLRH